MKKVTNSTMWRVMGFTLLVLLFRAEVSKSTALVNMYTTNCTAGANYIEFQLNITNSSTAGETLYINTAGTWRMVHGAGIVPTGTNTYTMSYVPNSCDPILNPAFATQGTTFSMSYTASSRLMQCTFTNTVLGNSAAAVNAPVLAGQTISAGKFRLTITNTNWVGSQAVGLGWSGTTSGIVAYVNTAITVTNFNTSTNRTLGTMCTMNTPAPCSVSASTSTTGVSCFGGNNGSASVTATGSSPFTYLWSPGGSTATSLSGLTAGNYTVTVTGSGGCTTSATAVVAQPAQLVASSSAGTIQCAGGNTTVTVSATGGTSPYTGTGTFTSPAGNYSYSIADSKGCTASTSGTIAPGAPLTTNTSSASACDSYTWALNGQTYTQSGSYTYVSGCQTNILNLTVTNSDSHSSSVSTCTSYTWAYNGNTYTQSGTYSSVTGCHTEVLYLTISTPPAPTGLACYQTATFNTSTCQWVVTGSQPAAPTNLACYQTATWNATSCQWVVTGSQPQQPTLACYQSTTFNNNTCQWDVTGSQPQQPTLACYQSATFNGTTCQWDVTGTQPAAPTGLACYQTATWNGTTCQWVVTGSQPVAPTGLACYQTATWNGITCQWDVTGTQPAAPTGLACYQTATWNGNTCQWVVAGSQPAAPTGLAC